MLANMGFAVLGGVAYEVLGLWKLRQQAPDNLPGWLRSKFYWGCTVAMILLGGVLAFVYSCAGVTLTSLTSFHVGVTAPLILSSFTEMTPRTEPGKTD